MVDQFVNIGRKLEKSGFELVASVMGITMSPS
jgi:hypothetical protein